MAVHSSKPGPAVPLVRRGRRPRGRFVVLSLASACVLVIGLGVGLHARGATASVAGTPSAEPSHPRVGVSALRDYRWHTLPRSPLTARTGSAAVWTGRELVVWGGTDAHDRTRDDGAAYDPARRTWTMVPSAPLSARTDPAFAWTGSSLLVWGGTDGAGHYRTDGAVYDPATRRWTKLPPVPAGATALSPSWAQAYAVGSEVVLLTTSGARSHREIHAVGYNAAGDTWTRLPSIRLVRHHDGNEVVAVPAGERLVVWSLWSHSTRVGDGSYEVRTGVDGYTLRPAQATWTRNRLTPDRGKMSDQPLWTGTRVLLPAEDIWCGYCPGPMLLDRTGLSLDPDTGARKKIPHGPVDDLSATYRWTGAALVAVDTTTTTSGAGRVDRPGEAAAWDPRTRTWTRLRAAPFAGGSVVVWTGRSVIVWGELYTPRGRPAAATGIEFSAVVRK